ncbi:MAG: hypothetical protein IJ484_08415 [Oscillospiraceae bacterium]|nr:hypothetical protein [Oscillospiraceae bacterium]
MLRKLTDRPVARTGLLYLAMATLYLLACLIGLAQGAYYTFRGLAPGRTLAIEDLTCESVVVRDHSYDESIPEGEVRIVSTDTDPHLVWEGEAWVGRVVLHIRQLRPATGAELYYRVPGKTEFDTKNVVFGVPDGQGGYVFDLRGKRVTGLRIDPDSIGGVAAVFEGVELNAARPWYKAFQPTGRELLWLAGGPLLISAAWELLRGLRKTPAH